MYVVYLLSVTSIPQLEFVHTTGVYVEGLNVAVRHSSEKQYSPDQDTSLTTSVSCGTHHFLDVAKHEGV